MNNLQEIKSTLRRLTGMEEKPFKVPESRLKITGSRGEGWTVIYPVSVTYNGGTTIDGEWYSGYEVPEPKVPQGFELVSLWVGLQNSAHPPYATNMLKPTTPETAKLKRHQVQKLCDQA